MMMVRVGCGRAVLIGGADSDITGVVDSRRSARCESRIGVGNFERVAVRDFEPAESVCSIELET